MKDDKKLNITEADLEALEKLPVNKWFDIWDISSVSRIEFRLNRLSDRGLIKRRPKKPYDGVTLWQYFKELP
jgi:predicted transcriptional regulator